MGGTLHEGGFYAYLQKTPNVDHLIFKGQTGNSSTGISYYFDSLVHTYVDGREVLLQYAPDGSLRDIWLRYEGSSDDQSYELTHGFDTIVLGDMRTHITGSYFIDKDTNSVFNIIIIHDTNAILFADLGSDSMEDPCYFVDTNREVFEQFFVKGECRYSYRWLKEIDYPQRAIQLDNGLVFAFDYIPAGLIVYRAKQNDDGDEPYVQIGEELCRLEKFESVSGTVGFYPEGTQCLLTTGYLEDYPVEVLQLMRNDIYARHGYEFKDPELRALYEAHGFWYQPSDDGTMTPLTATERLNVELISAVEKRKKQCQ